MRPPSRPRRSWWSAALVVAALFWTFDLGVLRSGVPGPLDDVWEYGVAARDLLHGDGFRTSVIHPPLWGLRDASLTVPVLVHGPALPLATAGLLAALGPAALDRVAWLAALFALLAAALAYRLGARLVSPALGAGAALLFTVSPLTIEAVHHDPSLLVGAVLLLAAFDRLARPQPEPAAAALALGVGVLVRPEMLLALPGLAMLAGGAGAVVLAAGVALFSGAWWWHVAQETGSPFFNLSMYMLVSGSERWPGLASLRDFALAPGRWPSLLAGQAPMVGDKALAQLPHALKRAVLAPTALTGWLAALGLLVSIGRRATRWAAVAALACALVPVAIMSLMIYDTRYLVPFLPLWALAAAAGAEWLWRRLPRVGDTPAWVAVLLLLALPATVPSLVRGAREGRTLEADLARGRAHLAALAGPAAAVPRLTAEGFRPAPRDTGAPRLLVSDAAAFVAWTTGRPTVWMTAAEYARLPGADPASPPLVAIGDSLPPRVPASDAWFPVGLR